MLRIDHRDRVNVIHLQHGKANAFDIEFCEHVTAALADLATKPEAVVLTGQGRIFSAGVDLKRVLEEGAPYVNRFVTALDIFCRSIFSFPRPLVAAVNGHAIAGGCVLACMADHRVMAAGSGRVGVPELLVGVPFPAAPLEVMRFVLPSRYIHEVVYRGATYEPPEALERGLIDEIVDQQDVIERAVAVAAGMAHLGFKAFGLTKAQIRRPVVAQMEAGAAALDQSVKEAWADPATFAAIRAYVDKVL